MHVELQGRKIEGVLYLLHDELEDELHVLLVSLHRLLRLNYLDLSVEELLKILGNSLGILIGFGDPQNNLQ